MMLSRCAVSMAATVAVVVLFTMPLLPTVEAHIPRRGLYVSLDTSYVSAAQPKYDLILAHLDRQDALFTYCRQHGFDALSLYDLQRVLPGRSVQLRAFVVRARRAGLRYIEAIGGPADWAWEDIVDYNKGCASDDEMFDGVVTEIEYWQSNPKNVSEMLAPVWHARGMNPVGRTDPATGVRRPFYFAAYIGWPDVGDIKDEMAAALDVVYMHSYRRTPIDAYAYTRVRMTELLRESSLTAVVIFSSEGTTIASATLNPFMGDWLAQNVNNTVQSAELQYLQDFAAEFPLTAANASRLWGFQWFHYYYSGHYDTHTTSRGPWLPENPSVSWPLVRSGSEWQNVAWCGEHSGEYTRCQDTSLVTMAHDVVFVDMFDTSAAVIAGLKPRVLNVNATSTASLPNRTVVCYYSAGTWENWRPDIANFTSGSLRGPMGSWPGEQWLDLFNATAVEQEIKPAMRWRLDLAKSKGCDAVEPDNVDCWQNSKCLLTSDINAGKAAQLSYNRWTAGEAHARGMAVGLKNDLEQITQLVDDYDFAVNENCHQYSECAMVLPFLQVDKAVFRTEYVSTLEVVCRDQDALALGPLHSTLRAVDGLWVACSTAAVNLTGSAGLTTTTTAAAGPSTNTTAAATTTSASGTLPPANASSANSTTTTAPNSTAGASNGTSSVTSAASTTTIVTTPPTPTTSNAAGPSTPGGSGAHVGGNGPSSADQQQSVSEGCTGSCGGFVAVVVVAAVAVGGVAIGVCVFMAKKGAAK